MLRAAFSFFKYSIFSGSVLLASVSLSWNGKSFARHFEGWVNQGWRQSERTAPVRYMSQMTQNLLKSTKDTLGLSQSSEKKDLGHQKKRPAQELLVSEQAKLRALIKEINSGSLNDPGLSH